jgi:hypothetical protein
MAVASIPSDVYAIGGILYWLLTGQLPGGASIAELTARFGGDGPAPSAPSPAVFVRDLDPDLCAICQRALAPSANDRHPAAGSLAEDLHTWLEHQPIAWTHPTARRRLNLLRKRRPVTTWMSAAGVLAIVLLIGGLFWQQRAAMQTQQLDAIEQARSDAVELYKSSAQQSIDLLRKTLDLAQQQGIGEEALLELDMAEHIFGTGLLDNPAAIAQLWNTRITIYREALQQLRAQGLQDSIQAALLQNLLGVWLLQASQYEEAQQVLTKSRSYFATLRSRDPIVSQLDALLAVAHILPLEPNSASRGQLRQWERAINKELKRQTIQKGGRRQKILYLEALEILYSTDNLNIPSSLDEVRSELRQLHEARIPSG